MEQLNLDVNESNSATENAKAAGNVTNGDDAFACCHLYRECSDAGRCISTVNGAENCIYRKNLENGIIFYGKKANDFNVETYNSIIEKYNSLDADCRKELDCAIIHFIKYRTTILWYFSEEIVKLAELGLFVLNRSPRAILELCHNNVVNSFLSDDARKEINRQRKAGKQAQTKKQDMIDWILSNPTPHFKEFASRFIYLSFPNDMRTYAFEIYYDFLQTKADAYTNEVQKRLPMKNESSFTGYMGRIVGKKGGDKKN